MPPGKETNSSVDTASLKKAKPRLRSDVLEIMKEKQSNVDRSAGPYREPVRHSPPRPLVKRRSSDREQPAASKAERKQKGCVFSRINFLAESSDSDRGAGKRRKISSDPPNGLKDHNERPLVNGYVSLSASRRSGGAADGYDSESSDEERHFKRRWSYSRRESEEEEAGRAPMVLREREHRVNEVKCR